MEDTSYQEMQLRHYSLKLMEISDDVDSLSKALRLSRDLAEENWKGLSGEACIRHLDLCCDGILNVKTKLSDMVILLEKMEKGDK